MIKHLQFQRGVTMIEAIVVIVITGIIGSVVGLFIRLPVAGYTNSVARAAATDLADGAMRRLTRDLRLALPNSVRVDAAERSIEFLQTTAGLRYLAEDDVDPALQPGDHLNWLDASKRRFVVVGGVPTDRHRPLAGNSIVVYNLGADQEPGNAYNCTGACNRAVIESVDATSITMVSNPFPAQAATGVSLTSPSKRFHVVTSPVMYVCDPAAGRIMRYWDYTITPSMVVPPTSGKSALLADRLKSCSFRYASLASQRTGLIGISLGVRVGGQPEGTLTLEHQVHVDNTP